MKTISTLLILAFAISSCTFKNVNRNLNEKKLNPTKSTVVTEKEQTATDEAAINTSEFNEEPQIVQDFFALDEHLFDKKDFNYNKSALKELVKSDNTSDKKGWSNYIVSADGSYLLFENMVDFALIEFKMIERNGQKQAFLNQVNGDDQLFTFLEYDEEFNRWIPGSGIPMPNKEDFFMENANSDLETIQEFGVSYAYISAESDDISFAFLDNETKRKSKGTYQREADFKYALAWDDEKFWLERKPIRK